MRSGRDRAVGATLIVAVTVLVAVVVSGIVRLDRDERRARADAVAEEAVLRTGFAVQMSVAETQRAIRTSVDGKRLPGVEANEEGAGADGAQEDDVLAANVVRTVPTAAFVPAADGSEVLGPLPGGVAGTAGFDTAAEAASDTGTPRVSEPLDDVGPVLVVPFYEEGDGVLQITPAVDTVRGRRTTIAGYVVNPIDVVGAIGELGTSVDGLEVADRDLTIATFGAVDREPDAFEVVDVGGRFWTVSSVEAPAGGMGGWARGLVVLVVLGAAAAFVTGVGIDRRRRRVTQRADREAERAAIIADLTPILQRSQRLADVLPSLGVQLSQRFGLAGIAVIAPDHDTDAESAELFVLGVRPGPAPAPVDPRHPVATGESVSLSLSRANRIVAELRFVAGEPLERDDLEGIMACAELVTSAIVTAQAVDRQRRAMAELTELDALKSVFLSTAAHELKTPVTAVGGLAAMLSRHWDQIGDDERVAVASRIATNTESLGSLVQDLLDFSRLEENDLRVTAEPLDLAPLVQAVVEQQALAWQTHEVVVSVEEGPAVLSDPIAIERITTNLVSNAVKYSPAGTTVTVSVRHVGDHVELVVDDQGSGVAVEDRERIFERFYRGEGPEVVTTRGVGIGLSVVREFVRKLGGTVVVDDASGGGARFICRFPHVPTSGPAAGTDPSFQDQGGSH